MFYMCLANQCTFMSLVVPIELLLCCSEVGANLFPSNGVPRTKNVPCSYGANTATSGNVC